MSTDSEIIVHVLERHVFKVVYMVYISPQVIYHVYPMAYLKPSLVAPYDICWQRVCIYHISFDSLTHKHGKRELNSVKCTKYQSFIVVLQQ